MTNRARNECFGTFYHTATKHAGVTKHAGRTSQYDTGWQKTLKRPIFKHSWPSSARCVREAYLKCSRIAVTSHKLARRTVVIGKLLFPHNTYLYVSQTVKYYRLWKEDCYNCLGRPVSHDGYIRAICFADITDCKKRHKSENCGQWCLRWNSVL